MDESINPTPIAELLDPQYYADKQTVMCVEGVIEKLFKVKRGQGNEGPYEFQNGIIRDDTGEIKVSFANNTQPDAARGCVVRMECYKSDQHGWTGLKVEDRGYESQNGWVEERQLKVTGTANIEYPQGLSNQGGGGGGGGGGGYRGGGGGARGQGANNRGGYRGGGGGQQQQRPPQQQQRPQQPPREQPTRPHNMANQTQQKPAGQAPQLPHPKLIIEDIVALHKDISAIVNETYKEEIEKGLDTSGFLATLFIEAARQGCVLDYKARAAKPPKKSYPPAPKDPSKWAECVLASGDYEGKTLAQVPDDYLKKLFAAFDEQGANHATAECVYKAAHDKGLVQPKGGQASDDAALDTAPDDIPF